MHEGMQCGIIAREGSVGPIIAGQTDGTRRSSQRTCACVVFQCLVPPPLEKRLASHHSLFLILY
jgi:hypothetical protein